MVSTFIKPSDYIFSPEARRDLTARVCFPSSRAPAQADECLFSKA